MVNLSGGCWCISESDGMSASLVPLSLVALVRYFCRTDHSKSVTIFVNKDIARYISVRKTSKN
jgi:hypothetical protein